jgi:hypothetical protein
VGYDGKSSSPTGGSGHYVGWRPKMPFIYGWAEKLRVI